MSRYMAALRAGPRLGRPGKLPAEEAQCEAEAHEHVVPPRLVTGYASFSCAPPVYFLSDYV